MISESSYKAARLVSATIENHFSEHIKAAQEKEEKNLAPLPEAWVIEAMIEAAFWASLRREEGHSPKISMAMLPPSQAGNPLLFEHRLPLTPDILTKLSPGVERPGVHLGVWYENKELYIWGTTLRIPHLCFVLDVSEPGLLVIKHRRVHGVGKFANVAVLMGDQIKFLNVPSSPLPHWPPLLSALLQFSSSMSDSVNVLVQLSVSMRSHKHGGTLLIVPMGNTNWLESIIHPIKYSVSPPYAGMANLMRKPIEERVESTWQASLKVELDSLAGLTAVDGATVINEHYELLAFGTKIARREGNSRVEKIILNEPIIGAEPITVNPSLTGGTRHLSAAQFVHDQRESLALVASQDGQFTIFSWSETKGVVQGHRIDTLLL